MAIVCIVFAVGLLAGAIGARDEGAGLRVFFLACALLNAAAAGHMMWTGHEAAWRLPASEIEDEPVYRR